MPTAAEKAGRPTGDSSPATEKSESADTHPASLISETREPQSAVRKDLINSDLKSAETARAPVTAPRPKVSGTQPETPRENTGTAPPPAVTVAEKVRGTKPKVAKQADSGKYECIVEMANVRATPDIKARILGRITQGTEVDVIGKEGKWMQFKYLGKTPAWIYGTLLRRADFADEENGER